MGFRNPITTVDAVDTGEQTTAGVRMYQAVDPTGIQRGVVEFRDGYGGLATLQLFRAASGGGGTSFQLTGANAQGITAPTLELAVEDLPNGGYGPAARILGGVPLDVTSGLTGLAYARLIATGNAPLSGTYGAGVWTSIPWGAAPLDSHAGWLGSGKTGWKVPTGQAGIYDLGGQVVFTADVGNPIRNARLLINGAVFPGCAGNNAQPGAGAGVSAVTGVKAVQLNAGDVVEVQGYSANAWSTTVYADAASNLEISRIR